MLRSAGGRAMEKPKSLKNYIDEVFTRFNHGDLQPAHDTSKTQFNTVIATDNIYWKKFELVGDWAHNWMAIQTAGPSDHGLLVFFNITGNKISANINNGFEGTNFVGEKAKTELSLLDAYLDHQKAADWFFQIMDQCIRFNFSNGQHPIQIQENAVR
jgi:hypothetical protein